MTAETGTYRWMAPEVIEHKPYGEKADIFSFAVVIWELLTCKVGGGEVWLVGEGVHVGEWVFVDVPGFGGRGMRRAFLYSTCRSRQSVCNLSVVLSSNATQKIQNHLSTLQGRKLREHILSMSCSLCDESDALAAGLLNNHKSPRSVLSQC